MTLTGPATLLVVAGTGTDVGKTWVSCRLLELVRAGGATVAARKPAQSFDPSDLDRGVPTDADHLAGATGEQPHDVCPPHRWYPEAMAPPMAATRLGRPTIRLDDLVDEIRWPAKATFGLVETAGGIRSPLADDGDGAALARRLEPDVVLLIAGADLGAIHAVRAAADAIQPLPTVVLLNRFAPDNPMHVANRDWLVEHDGYDVRTDVADLANLAVDGQTLSRPRP
jgi:dethiobiotin synthetase